MAFIHSRRHIAQPFAIQRLWNSENFLALIQFKAHLNIHYLGNIYMSVKFSTMNLIWTNHFKLLFSTLSDFW